MSATLARLEETLIVLERTIGQLIEQERSVLDSTPTPEDVIYAEKDADGLRHIVALCRAVKAETLRDVTSIHSDIGCDALQQAQVLLLNEFNASLDRSDSETSGRSELLLRTIAAIGKVVSARRRYGNIVDVVSMLERFTDEESLANELRRASELVTLKMRAAA